MTTDPTIQAVMQLPTDNEGMEKLLGLNAERGANLIALSTIASEMVSAVQELTGVEHAMLTAIGIKNLPSIESVSTARALHFAKADFPFLKNAVEEEVDSEQLHPDMQYARLYGLSSELLVNRALRILSLDGMNARLAAVRNLCAAAGVDREQFTRPRIIGPMPVVFTNRNTLDIVYGRITLFAAFSDTTITHLREVLDTYEDNGPTASMQGLADMLLEIATHPTAPGRFPAAVQIDVAGIPSGSSTPVLSRLDVATDSMPPMRVGMLYFTADVTLHEWLSGVSDAMTGSDEDEEPEGEEEPPEESPED